MSDKRVASVKINCGGYRRCRREGCDHCRPIRVADVVGDVPTCDRGVQEVSKRVASVKINCGGCLVSIAVLFGLWALLFGVTCNGRHYDLSCGRGEEVSP